MTKNTAPEGNRQASARSSRVGWPSLALAIAFGLLFAFQLFAALSNAFGVAAAIGQYNEVAALAGLDGKSIPWVALAAQLIIPPAAFVLSFLIGRRRSLGTQALLLVSALAVSAALYLSLNVLGGLLVR